jgi:apolipoprotein N-acyltransferase
MDACSNLIARLGAFPRLLALVLGAVAACGFQPLALWPLTLLALAVLIELLARAPSWKRAMAIGWLFGVAHFTVGNNWIATAFTYQANMPAWLGWIAVVLLSLYLAIYPMLATLGAWLFARRFARGDGILPWLGLAFVPFWIVSEWLRSWVFTGFAWNPLGVVLLGDYDAQGLALLAPWLGTYGLSGLVVALAAAARAFIRRFAVAGARGRLALLGYAPLAVAVAGAMIVPARYIPEPQGAIAFTLVQPDIRQEVLDDPRLFEAHFVKTARLSAPRQYGQQRIVFWPESGVPDYLRDGYPPQHYLQMTYAADPARARRRIGELIGPRALLLTGAVDLVIEHGDAVAARNSITAIDGRGDILAGYAKAHLVPYGEYLALRWLLEPLGATRLVPGALDFWPGPGPLSYDFGPWGKAGMQICYEIVFSGQVVDRHDRPDYIFNPSNDGWFGDWGPPQHLAQARLRAIEEGLPVLRATTTGISAVIDADGIVRQHIPRHVAGRLDGRIPPAHPPTPFARLGNALPLAWAALLLVISLVAMRRRRS